MKSATTGLHLGRLGQPWRRTRPAYTAVATDADGDPLSYSLSGTDAARFTIDATTGAVSFTASPDFENPGDAGGNNVYDIIVTASDGINETTRSVAITVTDENDNTPVFTSPASAEVAENQTRRLWSIRRRRRTRTATR